MANDYDLIPAATSGTPGWHGSDHTRPYVLEFTIDASDSDYVNLVNTDTIHLFNIPAGVMVDMVTAETETAEAAGTLDVGTYTTAGVEIDLDGFLNDYSTATTGVAGLKLAVSGSEAYHGLGYYADVATVIKATMVNAQTYTTAKVKFRAFCRNIRA